MSGRSREEDESFNINNIIYIAITTVISHNTRRGEAVRLEASDIIYEILIHTYTDIDI